MSVGTDPGGGRAGAVRPSAAGACAVDGASGRLVTAGGRAEEPAGEPADDPADVTVAVPTGRVNWPVDVGRDA